MKDLRDDRRQGADTQTSAVVYGVSDADLLALAHYAASRQRGKGGVRVRRP